MAIEWSGLSPELLEARLREAIRGGRLHAGEWLPSSRELARELGAYRGNPDIASVAGLLS